VDGCVGAFFLPFLEQEGYDVPSFDFRVEGVETISADLHKYGYAPRGISMLLTRRPERLQHQFFTFGFPPPRPEVWYRTPGVAGSRPGASVAAAWAVMAYLGREGYGRLTRTCREYCERMWATINSIEGLYVNGRPHMPLFTYSADDRIFPLAVVTKGMEDRGWLVHKDVFPRPLVRLMQAPAHAPFIDEYLADLAEVAAQARQGAIAGEGADAAYT
jgi:sphinganine-1-phosphate aldolase